MTRETVALELDKLLETSRELLMQSCDIIVLVDVISALSHLLPQGRFHDIQVTLENRMLPKPVGNPSHTCFMREDIRHVWGLLARIGPGIGPESMLLQCLEIVAHDVACGRLVESWAVIGKDNPGHVVVSADVLLANACHNTSSNVKARQDKFKKCGVRRIAC